MKGNNLSCFLAKADQGTGVELLLQSADESIAIKITFSRKALALLCTRILKELDTLNYAP